MTANVFEEMPPSDGQGPSGELLKDSPLRSVIRLFATENRPAAVLKTYRTKGLLERVRSLWLRSRALVEAANLDTARARGLPCPEPFRAACARGAFPREGWLVLADLGPGRALDRALVEDPGAGPALLAKAGALLSLAFATGLRHRDLHLGNVYVDAQGELHLLDLHAARFEPRPIEPRARDVRGLYLGIVWPEEEGLRAALLTPLGLPASPPELGGWLRAHLERRLRRCLRTSGSFVRTAGADGESWIARRGLAGTPREWRSELAAGRTVKSGRRGRVVATRDRYGKLRDEAAALSLWLAAEALALRRIPHAPALAWFRDDSHRFWVLSATSEGQPLEALAEAPPREQHRLAEDLARSFARLHATGWRCRDPRGDNFHFRDGRVVFLDLDGIRPFPRWRRAAVRAADLGRLLAWVRHEAPSVPLTIPRALERRFFVAYVRALRALGGTCEAGSLAARIQLRSERWRKRHR